MASQQNKKPKKKKYIKRADSKDALRTFSYSATTATVYPDFSYQKVLQALENEPMVWGAIQHYVDKCMEGDYSIVKVDGDNFAYDKTFEMLLDTKYKFRTDILRKIFLLGKIYNNVFVEIVRGTDNKVVALNVLDSFNVEPITEPNGDPIRYKSATPHPETGEHPMWEKEEIVWIKFGDRSVGYAPVDLKVLWETLLVKDAMRSYQYWLTSTGQYRILYNPKNASNESIKDFLSYIRKHDDNYKVPFFVKGDLDVKMLRDMKELESWESMYKYWDNQILITLRIPPIDAGIPDASGRSNADAQSNNLDAHITSGKKVVEDAVSFDLFKKMNKGNNMLRFGPNNRFSEKQVFEVLQIMQSLGISKDMMEEYLQDKGMFFGATIFEPMPEMMPNTENPRDLDTMPSRQGLSEGESQEDIGTGQQASTREDQL